MFAYCEEQSTKVGKQLELLFRLKFDEFEKETRSACSHPTGEKSRTAVVTARSAACSARPHEKTVSKGKSRALIAIS